MNRKKVKSNARNIEIFAWWIIAIGVSAIFLTAFFFLKGNFRWMGTIATDKLDHFGSFISGLVGTLFSLASILLVIATLKAQKQQFIDLQEDNAKQQVENHFFYLLKIHQKNKYKSGLDTEKFGQLLKEFKAILASVKENIVLTPPLKNLEKKQINIAYLVFFFGLSSNKDYPLRDALNFAKINEEVIKKIIDERRLLISKQKDDEESPSIVFSPGYSNILGHYFRQLFQLVNYIVDSKILTFSEKYFYIRILRSHMSDNEQVLFFFNSLSYLGRNWKKKIIINYKLTHNAPNSLFGDIDREKYYPQPIKKHDSA